MYRTLEIAQQVNELDSERKRIIAQGTVEELIAFAKEYNIHQTSTNAWYLHMCDMIKTKLLYYGVDPESVRQE